MQKGYNRGHPNISPTDTLYNLHLRVANSGTKMGSAFLQWSLYLFNAFILL